MTQLSLFDELPERPAKRNQVPSLDRFEGALLCSTIGDALGWPTEFLKPTNGYRLPFSLPLKDFISWGKLVGGKWWGYDEKIEQGEYSDDTQLSLAIARCIAETGQFEPERFAYEELPLWLQYERGGGKSVKTAARRLVGKNADWQRNFYKQRDLDYKTAGANGAAMRNLPIALVNVNHESRLIKDSFLNAIITHGHPRAILGTILFALAVRYALTAPHGIATEAFVEYLREGMNNTGKAIIGDDRIALWIQRWQQEKGEQSFPQSFKQTYQEAIGYLKSINQYVNTDVTSYYTFVGALEPLTKGSGVATVCVAIYLFLKYLEEPETALITAVNMLGSDTDTISVFLGSLLGAYHGKKAVPTHLSTEVQDRDYLLKTAKRLHSIAGGEQEDFVAENQAIQRTDAYFRILAWEIGLHEMFWDALREGSIVVHPTLGRGTITKKEVKPIKRDGYVAKLILIKFDCEQSCTFHSRVEHNEKVSESLAEEVIRALQ
jgi:ADP-ribosylglycohydrolase